MRNPASSSQSLAMVQTISGDEVTLYTLPGATSTDIWIQAGAEIIGSAPLEQIRHGTYNGTTFTWDSATVIPGTVSPGRQDPSVTWTGKWLIATWWDDTSGSDSDNVFMNWTADKTGQSGWLTTAISPSVPCRTGAAMPRCLTCGSANTSSILLMGPLSLQQFPPPPRLHTR